MHEHNAQNAVQQSSIQVVYDGNVDPTILAEKRRRPNESFEQIPQVTQRRAVPQQSPGVLPW